MISCIYTITNKVNNKLYVGKTNNFLYRMSKHKYTLRHNIHVNEHLQRAFNKYSEESFNFEILEECEIEYLYSQEHYWCNLLDVFNYNKGYNIKSTHPLNKSGHSADSLEKVKKTLTGRKLSLEHKLKLSLAKQGKKLPDEVKLKMSQASKGKKKSEEHKLKISEAKKGDKNPRFGKIPWNKKM